MNSSPDLFSPLKLGPETLPNRIIMAPLTRCRARRDHVPTTIMARYYAQRASAGLIIGEATFVSPQGVGYPNAPGIYTREQVHAWRQVTDAVHRQDGRIFLQLWHVGRVSHPSYYGGDRPVAPSAIAPTDGQAATDQGRQPFVTPRALRRDEIPDIVQQFRQAAVNAKAVGFDGVEIHAANGFLLDQFLRDGSNKRTDEYGGSVANRVRLTLEVTAAVADVWDGGRVGIRISPTGTYNSMTDSNPEVTFTHLARQLNRHDLAYLHVVEAWGGDLRHGAHVMSLALLRDAYRGTIVVNGGYDQDKGQAVISQGLADAVAYGQLFVANPDLPARFQSGAKLNTPDKSTFYRGQAKGYLDYPFLPGGCPHDRT